MQGKHIERKLKILQTSDIHGNLFPFNFITRQPWKGGMSRISTLIKDKREKYGENLILLDNGDILQGQPSVYFYNYIDTQNAHLCASVMNYMKYDIGNMGNHDIETGRNVFERWAKECDFPILGANITERATRENYLPPYKIIERNEIRLAVLGMVTPAIPAWLPENIWKGLHFNDMERSARYWMQEIIEKESPDIIIGLFHAGSAGNEQAGFKENPSMEIACKVRGFDIILMGHDHVRSCQSIQNNWGDEVVLMNPGSNGHFVSEIDLICSIDNGKIIKKEITGQLLSTDNIEIDSDYMSFFKLQYDSVESFVSRKIGYFKNRISTREAFFGSSAFVDFIHSLQLSISHADISFVAPLSFDAHINEGDVFVSDMFSLYKYENLLYVLELTGKEIKDYLEYSYSIWTNQMTSSDDCLLLFRAQNEGKKWELWDKLAYPSYNFDSAAGINYTVDVTKPQGQKINILSMSNGTSFKFEQKYKVAMNSYRGNGGGELLTEGVGISKDKLKERLLYASEKDLRYYMLKHIEERKIIEPVALKQWKFIPEAWVEPAIERDYITLFG